MAVSQKLVERLKAFDAKKADREIEGVAERLRAEAEKVRLAGPDAKLHRNAAIVQAIFDELVKLVPDVKFVAPTFHIADVPHTNWKDEMVLEHAWRAAHIKHEHLSFSPFKIDEEYTSGNWCNRPTGKLRITVGDYGERKSYPQRRNGSHNYAAIAAEISYIIAQRKNRAEAEAARKANEGAMTQLRILAKDHKPYGGVQFSASSDPQKPIRMKIDLDRCFSVADAAAIANFLKEYNIG